MRAKRVILLSNHSLLSAGVQRLLQSMESLDLSIVAAEDQKAISGLRRLAPEVIVLDSSDPSLGDGIITRLLAQHPEAKVIAFNVNRAGIDVYRMNRIVETGLDGLIEAIQGKRQLPRNEADRNAARKVRSVDGGGTMGP